jgi:hypothetical protein
MKYEALKYNKWKTDYNLMQRGLIMLPLNKLFLFINVVNITHNTVLLLYFIYIINKTIQGCECIYFSR